MRKCEKNTLPNAKMRKCKNAKGTQVLEPLKHILKRRLSSDQKVPVLRSKGACPPIRATVEKGFAAELFRAMARRKHYFCNCTRTVEKGFAAALFRAMTRRRAARIFPQLYAVGHHSVTIAVCLDVAHGSVVPKAPWRPRLTSQT